MLGWQRQPDGRWLLGLFIENGRIAAGSLQAALAEIAAQQCSQFLMTPTQNLMLTDIDDKTAVTRILKKYGIRSGKALSGLRQNAMACVALPTCPLAMAESERYLPDLVQQLERILTRLGLRKEAISIRMTGCPNGCARPYLGEIGLVGKSPGRYNLYLGASHAGTRLSTFCEENLDEAAIISTLTPLLESYAKKRLPDESFGDFLIRHQHSRRPQEAADFHPRR